MNNIIKLKFTSLQQEILRFLFQKAEKTFNARQLAITLKVSQTAISKSLPLLKKNKLIKVTKESGRLSIKLNRENQKIFQAKQIENLRTIYESELTSSLENEFPGKTIILFGSYSRGDDISESDIDIAIIAPEKQINLKKFEKILSKKININFYPEFRNIHKNLKENLCNGILLAGGIEI